jgi:hypothetical protein
MKNRWEDQRDPGDFDSMLPGESLPVTAVPSGAINSTAEKEGKYIGLLAPNSVRRNTVNLERHWALITLFGVWK